MDIGKEKKKIVIEPVRSPVPDRDPTPAREPVRVPEPPREPVRVGIDR